MSFACAITQKERNDSLLFMSLNPTYFLSGKLKKHLTGTTNSHSFYLISSFLLSLICNSEVLRLDFWKSNT